VANAFDILNRLVRLFPQFAGFAPFSIGERDDAGFAAVCRDDGNDPGGAPDEVRRVRAHHQQGAALLHILTPIGLTQAAKCHVACSEAFV
jgi:hypothetical protein